MTRRIVTDPFVLGLAIAACLGLAQGGVTYRIHALNTIAIQNPSFENATLSANAANGAYSQLIVGSSVVAAEGTLTNWVATSSTVNAAAGAYAPDPGGVIYMVERE